jgi:nucleoside 2-deoxyribosyltransferase
MAAHSVYLAGPEVFLADGRDLIERKRELSRRHGFTPADLHGEFSATGAGEALALDISRRNESLMDQADLCVANLTPFRGISADPGTVYEVGYVIGGGKPVYGYSADPRPYAERVHAELGPLSSSDGRLQTREGELVEDHGWADNLMIEGGIRGRGWTFIRATTPSADPWRDLAVFERCLRIAAAELA